MAFQKNLAGNNANTVLFRQAAITATNDAITGTPPHTDVALATQYNTVYAELGAGTTTTLDYKRFDLSKEVARNLYEDLFIKTEHGKDFRRDGTSRLLDVPTITVT